MKDHEALSATWWNGLPKRAQEILLERAGTAANAWVQFNANPGIMFEIGVQVGQEQAGTQLGEGAVS